MNSADIINLGHQLSEEVSELEQQLAVLLFAYLPKWKSART